MNSESMRSQSLNIHHIDERTLQFDFRGYKNIFDAWYLNLKNSNNNNNGGIASKK